MKVIGFSFIRNAIRYDYPIVEAIQSILPICDRVVVAVGKSDDDTLALVRNLAPDKIDIIETIWDDSKRAGGVVLAEETDKALAAIAADADWCVYIQGDEVLPEWYHQTVRTAMQTYLNDSQTQGLLFKYRHFYGSYDFVGTSRRWYRHEIRVIRNDKSIRSYLDAQGFRCEGKKLKVRAIDAYIHHYGWVKNPAAQQRKQENFNRYWHSDDWVAENIPPVSTFDYGNIDDLQRYIEPHPTVMSRRIAALNWHFDFDPTQRRLHWRERLSRWFEQKTGWRVGEYKNYKLLKKTPNE